MFKPMFVLHKNANGEVLTAAAFKRNYEFSDWVRHVDVRPGDTLEFKETIERPEFDEVEPDDAFLTKTPEPQPALADDEQPF